MCIIFGQKLPMAMACVMQFILITYHEADRYARDFLKPSSLRAHHATLLKFSHENYSFKEPFKRFASNVEKLSAR